ncbi:MAG: NAD-dependent epimerase/dehydratase family protein [Parasphingorhabdus sp.]|uniref:NAD-dependent epimerase/dehydratase family protein n=1 Tax=Parasphingorhabdus sp. TaxID=2709688 RepID=UPI0032995085
MTKTAMVSGGTGYIATYVIRQLLDEGWHVNTTIRSIAREADAHRRFPEAGNKLKFFQADLMHDEGWAAAMADCSHMVHIASPIMAATPKHENDLILPARDGVLRALQFSKDAGVQRFVHTSSMAAVSYGVERGVHEFDESDWTDENHPDASAYTKSKTISERAARDWIAKNGDVIEYCSVNPGMVLGPVVDADFSASVLAVQQLMDGSMPMAPDISFPLVDVRDVADLHVKAMMADNIAGDRFLAAGPTLSFLEMAKVLRDNLGDKAQKVPTRQMPDWLVTVFGLINSEVRGIKSELGKRRVVTGTYSQDKLAWTMRPVEQSLIDTANSLLSRGVVTV